jgi:1-acyl-sn-glycerol-3-phosphate acyltransferase
MRFVRSLVYALLFYPGTLLWVIAGLLASLFARRPTLAVVLSWVGMHHWLAEHVLGIRTEVSGTVPPGPHLIAAKHQSMFETLEMVRVAHLPVIVMKSELADVPLFGLMTRRYGVIVVERSAGAKALRRLVAEGKRAIASGRSVIIFPEGTRVRPGETPPLKSGFAALYRVLGLPVVPVAIDSGEVWGRGFIRGSGTIRFQVEQTIPPGLARADVEARVHAAINAFESGAQPGP